MAKLKDIFPKSSLRERRYGDLVVGDPHVVRFEASDLVVPAGSEWAGSAAQDTQYAVIVGGVGTFTLTIDGHTTAPIQRSGSISGVDTAAATQAALEALPQFDPGDIEVSYNGTYVPGYVYFHGAWSGQDVTMTIDTSGMADGDAMTAGGEAIKDNPGAPASPAHVIGELESVDDLWGGGFSLHQLDLVTEPFTDGAVSFGVTDPSRADASLAISVGASGGDSTYADGFGHVSDVEFGYTWPNFGNTTLPVPPFTPKVALTANGLTDDVHIKFLRFAALTL